MTKISLRAYNHEIEKLIDSGSYIEAIAHCRYILQQFPKYINIYRLLGKAFLESQQYGEAVDIFQRVLAVIPDDFVSHAGMSIIREDEGDLDNAIWHMERAFEVQPSNAAIQEELRRLYGRRDGVEPSKIFLTRGALARMYAKGNLYQQAIAELRSALSDNPQQIDLQLQLARMYALSGQRVEAVETSNNIRIKLPYCLEANQILADILAGTERANESQACRQRIQAIDPYLAFISPNALTPDKVPDDAITLDWYSYSANDLTSNTLSQPGWAQSLGIDVNAGANNSQAMPDWLSIQPTEPETFQTGATPFDQPLTGSGQEQEIARPQISEKSEWEDSQSKPTETIKQLPDWMKAAGWSTGDKSNEVTGNVDFQEGSADEEELAPAEIPDWLRTMAPENIQISDKQVDDQNAGMPDVFGTNDEQSPIPEAKSILHEDLSTSTWQTFDKAGTSIFEERSVEPDSNLPDWLIASVPEINEYESITVPETSQSKNVSEGLINQAKGLHENPPGNNSGLLSEVEVPLEGIPSEAVDPVKEATKENALFPDDNIDIPEWLRNLSVETTPTNAADSNNLFETESIPIEIPNWLSASLSENAPLDNQTAESDLQKEIIESGTPNPLSGEEKQEFTNQDVESALLDWLENMGSKQSISDQEAVPLPEKHADKSVDRITVNAQESQVSNRLPDLSDDGIQETKQDWVNPIAGEDKPLPFILESESESITWPVAEEKLVTEDKKRDKTPDWLAKKTNQIDGITPIISQQDGILQANISSSSDVTSLEIAETIVGDQKLSPSQQDLSNQAEVELPDWLKGFLDKTPEDDLKAVHLDSDESPALPAENIPDWLQTIAKESGVVDSPTLPSVDVILAQEQPEQFPELPLILGDTQPMRIKVQPIEIIEPIEGPVIEIPQTNVEEEPISSPLELIPEYPLSEGEPISPIDETNLDIPIIFEQPILPPSESEEIVPTIDSEPKAASENLPVIPVTPEETILPTSESEEIVPTIDSEPKAASENLPIIPVTPEETILPTSEIEAFTQIIPEEPSITSELPKIDEALIISQTNEGEWLPEVEIPVTNEPDKEALPDWLQAFVDTESQDGEIAWTPPAIQETTQELPEQPLSTAEIESSIPIESTPDIDAFLDQFNTTSEKTIEAPPPIPLNLSDLQIQPQKDEGVEASVISDLPDVIEKVEQLSSAETSEVDEVLPIQKEEIQIDLPIEEKTIEEVLQGIEPPTDEQLPEVVEEIPVTRIDLNSASLRQLEQLPGVGFVLAQKIIAYRDTFGAYTKLDDLGKVDGIDQTTLDEVKTWVTIENPEIKPSDDDISQREAKSITQDDSFQSLIIQARNILIEGDVNRSLEKYTGLINNHQLLDEVINDLRLALKRHPRDFAIFQALGDAYLHNNQLQDALDTYSKAEEMLR